MFAFRSSSTFLLGSAGMRGQFLGEVFPSHLWNVKFRKPIESESMICDDVSAVVFTFGIRSQTNLVRGLGL